MLVPSSARPHAAGFQHAIPHDIILLARATPPRGKRRFRLGKGNTGSIRSYAAARATPRRRCLKPAPCSATSMPLEVRSCLGRTPHDSRAEMMGITFDARSPAYDRSTRSGAATWHLAVRQDRHEEFRWPATMTAASRGTMHAHRRFRRRRGAQCSTYTAASATSSKVAHCRGQELLYSPVDELMRRAPGTAKSRHIIARFARRARRAHFFLHTAMKIHLYHDAHASYSHASRASACARAAAPAISLS